MRRVSRMMFAATVRGGTSYVFSPRLCTDGPLGGAGRPWDAADGHRASTAPSNAHPAPHASLLAVHGAGAMVGGGASSEEPAIAGSDGSVMDLAVQTAASRGRVIASPTVHRAAPATNPDGSTSAATARADPAVALAIQTASVLIRTPREEVVKVAMRVALNYDTHLSCTDFVRALMHRIGFGIDVINALMRFREGKPNELMLVVTAVRAAPDGEVVLVVLVDPSIKLKVTGNSMIKLLDETELRVADVARPLTACVVRNYEDQVMAETVDAFHHVLSVWTLDNHLAKLFAIDVYNINTTTTTKVRVAADKAHILIFTQRHCDFRRYRPGKREPPMFLNTVTTVEDFKTDDPQVTQLLGGESGSGKTMTMLAGSSVGVSFVVYMCLPVTNVGGVAEQLWIDLNNSHQASVKSSQATDTRNEIFLRLVVALVKGIISKELYAYIANAGGERDACEELSVRFAFDEAGRYAAAMHALCAVGAAGIRDALGWPPEVRVHAVIGGTGVGSVSSGGSVCTRYRLKMLEPSRSVWDAMCEFVKKRPEMSTSLGCLLAEAKKDAVCRAAVENPRLAALIAVECQILANATTSYTFKRVHPGEFRFRVLLPAAERYKSLNGLQEMSHGEQTRQVLVAALRHALPAERLAKEGPEVKVPTRRPSLCDYDTSVPVEVLVREYGVLVDNSRFQLRSKTSSEHCTVMRNGDNCEMTNPAASGEVACYPTATGRYSISPAMVAELYLLLMGNSSSYIADSGDQFEVAVAQMVYIAVQVHEGRRVVELLRFLFGDDALSPKILGKFKNGKDLNDAMVVFGRLELRYNRTPKHDAAALDANLWKEGPLSNGEKWKRGKSGPAPADGTAWVEVSPGGLSSAGVVLHIPGVLTLPIQCKHQKKLSTDKVTEKLGKMPDFCGKSLHKKFGEKLAKLSGGTPVLAVVCDTGLLFKPKNKTKDDAGAASPLPPPDETPNDDQAALTATFSDAVIVVSEYGAEGGNDRPTTRESVIKRTRRSLLAFNQRVPDCTSVDVVEAVGHNRAP